MASIKLQSLTLATVSSSLGRMKHLKCIPKVNSMGKTREKDVVGIATFDLIGLLPTNHIIACTV